MKSKKYIIKKYFALSTLTIYLFVSLAYIFFLPKYTFANQKVQSRTATVSLKTPSSDIVNRSSNPHTLFRKIFKSTTQKRRDLAAILLLAAALLVYFIISYTTSRLVGNPAHPQRFSPTPHQYYYLDFCSLRV